MKTFHFRFAAAYRVAAAPFGVTPQTARVEVDDARLVARFGAWLVQTEVANVAGTELTGPYPVPKTVGPAHVSLKDRGLTFATNPDRGLCIRFREPVAGLDPLHRLRHPALTVTVEDPEALAAALAPGAAEAEETIDLTPEQAVAADTAMLLDLGGSEELAEGIAAQSGGGDTVIDRRPPRSDDR